MSTDSVLVVEDDDVIRRQVHRVLEGAGYSPRAAENCTVGLALALEEMPNLLVLDISLPDGTGWSLLEDIRRERPEANPPVIVMSSERVSRNQLREYKVNRFFPKPFDMSHFLEAVSELME